MGKIVLAGLEFHGRHGVFAEEKRFGARFLVDIEMELNYQGIPDDVTYTIDYAQVYATVEDETVRERYYLIEVLANNIADRLMREHQKLNGVLVRVHKPHAPIPGVFRDVYVEVARRR